MSLCTRLVNNICECSATLNTPGLKTLLSAPSDQPFQFLFCNCSRSLLKSFKLSDLFSSILLQVEHPVSPITGSFRPGLFEMTYSNPRTPSRCQPLCNRDVLQNSSTEAMSQTDTQIKICANSQVTDLLLGTTAPTPLQWKQRKYADNLFSLLH